MVKKRNIFVKILNFAENNDWSIWAKGTKHLIKSQIKKIYPGRKVIQVIVEFLKKHNKNQGFFNI